VAEDYLRIIWKAKERNAPLATKDIAGALGVSPTTVSGNLRKLDGDGLIEHDPYYPVTLTEKGRTVAVAMVRRHRLLEAYLVDHLGYRWDQVHEEAEALEHAVSDLFVARIDKILGHPSRDPHGDPIPSADGSLPPTDDVELTHLPEGTVGVVSRVYDDAPEVLRYLSHTGIGIGTRLRLIEFRKALGLVRVEVDDAPGLELPVAVAAVVHLSV
jgi:DtxR family Mn-dependent transcriptional regulator